MWTFPFSTRCVIRTWKAPKLWPHAYDALMMHFIETYFISTWALVLASFSSPHVQTLGRSCTKFRLSVVSPLYQSMQHDAINIQQPIIICRCTSKDSYCFPGKHCATELSQILEPKPQRVQHALILYRKIHWLRHAGRYGIPDASCWALGILCLCILYKTWRDCLVNNIACNWLMVIFRVHL